MNHQGLTGITDTHPLAFGIHNDLDRHFQIGILININVTISIKMFHHRHGRFLHHTVNQPRTATGNGNIDTVLLLQQKSHCIPVSRIDQLHGMFRNSNFLGNLQQHIDQCLAGMSRFLASPQNNCISTFYTNSSRIRRHVRTRLIDEKDDS